MNEMRARIASAPISWGISEVPNWGFQLPPERVLREMTELGYMVTEIGPDGFLPTETSEKASRLAEFGLSAAGSFVPVVLHDKAIDPSLRIRRELEVYETLGCDALILCAVTGREGYDGARAPLTDDEWATLFANVEALRKLAADQGVDVSLHPHVGSVVENADEVDRVLRDSDISFCFDTGHLMIGGVDPVRFVEEHADRIGYTHLKDVSLEVMQRVKSGETSYYQGIIDGLYTPLGRGDVDIRAIIDALLRSGYTGWIVAEQDKVLTGGEPADSDDPIHDARENMQFLQSAIAGQVGAGQAGMQP